MISGGGLTLRQLDKLAHALDLEIIVRPRSQKPAILGKPIETLGLSVRAQNCLTVHARKPIHTIRQLVSCSETALAAIPHCGLTVVEEVRHKLAQHGLRLKGERQRRV